MSIELQDILEQYADEYIRENGVSSEQYKAIHDIIYCRTSEFGGHIDECDECGHIELSYNSCRNRHCPKCQTFTKEKWIDARKNDNKHR